MALIDELREEDKKGLFTSADAFVNYSTGFLPLDYAIGFMLKVKSGGIVKEVPITGLLGGTFVTMIGGSGTGKTTLADQIAFNIIKPYEHGIFIHADCELTALKQRICNVTGASEDDPRIILDKENITIEDVLLMIDKICDKKESGGDKYKYEVIDRVYSGKSVKMFQPTVIVIDSLKQFNPADLKSSELEGSMAGGRSAKEIAQFYNKCLMKMYKYNITIIAVNHITAAIQINMYQPVAKQLVLLNAGESLPKGSAPVYLAHTLMRLNQYAKSSMYTKEENGFKGFKVKVQFTKSKTAFIGSEIDIAFNTALGFDPIYSLYEFASSCGLIEGRNPYLYIKGGEAFKFNRKFFDNEFVNNEAFRNHFMSIIQPYLEAMIGATDISDEERTKMQALSLEYIGATDGDLKLSADMGE